MPVTPPNEQKSPRSRRTAAVAFAIIYPSVLTLAYFVLLAGFAAGVQQAVYAIGKLVQFAFPLVWVAWVLGWKPSWQWPDRSGIKTGLAFGAFVLVAMVVLYYAWLKPSPYLQGVAQQATQKVSDLGLNTLWKYAAVGVFYALVHSLMEEYYWRWFVFGQLRHTCGLWTSIALSSAGFMAHHIILLATFFGWDSPLAYLFSFGVAIGGAVWAWLYDSSQSLLGPWLSHMLVDAAIFLIGYDLVRSQLG